MKLSWICFFLEISFLVIAMVELLLYESARAILFIILSIMWWVLTVIQEDSERRIEKNKAAMVKH